MHSPVIMASCGSTSPSTISGPDDEGNHSIRSRINGDGGAKSVTEALKGTLTVTKTMKAAFKKSRALVVRLRRELIRERQGKKRLRKQITKMKAALAKDTALLLRLYHKFLHERAIKGKLRRDLIKTKAANEIDAAGNAVLPDTIENQQEIIHDQTKAIEEFKQQQENINRSLRIFAIWQGGTTANTMYDIDIDFRTVLEDYAGASNQNANRLRAHDYGTMELIELDHVFTVP